MNSELDVILNIVRNSKVVLLAGHTNPDADSVSACIAMAFALEKMNIKPIILLEDYSDNINITDGNKFIYSGDYTKIEKFDLIISLDAGSLDRLSKSEQLFKNAPVSICIDHHISNTFFGKYNYVLPNASSTCEIVYDIIKQLIGEIDIKIASVIYAGILTDTGGFRHKSTNENTMNIVSELILKNIPFTEIYNSLLLNMTLVSAKIFSKAISSMKIIYQNKIAYAVLKISDFEEAGAISQDAHGIVDFLINIENVEVGIFIYEKADNLFKFSFRSKEIDINKVASKFDGGGHKLAAGCVINKPQNEAIESVLTIIKSELEK